MHDEDIDRIPQFYVETDDENSYLFFIKDKTCMPMHDHYISSQWIN